MGKQLNPGILIAIFLNVVLLLGTPFFGEGEASHLAPLILLALAMPWILYWAVGRMITGLGRELRREDRREEDGPPDFV